jgi:asparagine synthase (glutamine-hydrolysing)
VCGICGVISVEAIPVEDSVRRMMRAMIHRGPDDEGYEERPLGRHDGTRSTVGLGFRRLAILDLSPAGHQPMVNPATGDCLIFNGEIYNFVELRSRLRAEGIEVSSSGDTEVLLKALSHWGERALEELDGMFALAFYEARNRRVLLARDHLGIKPLYVAQSRGKVVFASEIRAVLASGLVSNELDPAGIATMLAYGSPQDPLTVLKDVRSFPSGSFCWFTADAGAAKELPTPRCYWNFPAVSSPVNERDALEKIGSLIDSAVREQILSDVPLGVFLSAGIDSGTLAALVHRLSPSLRTHCVGFRSGEEMDERQAAAATAAAIGSQHSETVLTDANVKTFWHQWLDAADRPGVDGLNTYIVCAAIKQAGITVALSGGGADEIFGGYSYFTRVPALYRKLRGLAALPTSFRRSLAYTAGSLASRNRRERAVDLVSHLDSPLDVLLWRRRIFSNAQLAGLGVRPGELGLSPHYLPQAEQQQLDAEARIDTFQSLSRAECRLYLANTVLRDVDVNSMAHSLEVRVPYLSRRLVDYTASLPGSMHQPAGGSPKHLLRQIGRDLLPPSVFTRTKTGFCLPMAEWMLGPNRDSCAAAVDAVATCPVFNAGAVRSLWNDFVAHPEQCHWNRPLALVALGSYLMRHARI